MKMTFCRQGQEVHKGKDIEQTPQSKVSKTIIKLTTFFHSLVILYHISGADPGFQVRGAHLAKLRRAEGGAKFFGVFRVKNHDFTQKNHIFSNFRRGARRVRPPGSTPASKFASSPRTESNFLRQLSGTNPCK